MTRNETSPDDAAPTRQRIAKLMARVGLCSRRDAEAWIVEGRVSVNGTVLTSPAVDVAPDDRILVDGAPLPKAEKTRLFLFHKPRGLVTSDHDPEGRATVADYLREHWPEGPRVVTVGRLDITTEGLLLLTNDGGLARILELPRTGWVRRYRVRAKGETDQAVLDGLREGVTIDGIDYAGIEATLDRVQGANVWLTMALREGKNREVKRVLESIGLEVNRLIRLSFGPFQLGDLPEGAVEEVRTRVLRDQLGPTLAAAAGVAFEGPAAAPETARTPREARTGTTTLDQRERPAREKPKRDERHATPGAETKRGSRSGDRPRLRPSEAPPPLRERPAAGTRKHVSTLRAADAAAAQHGPRRRIERSDVTDRKDRAVRVERLVDTRPARPEPRPLRQRDHEAPRGRRPERPRDRDREDARHAKPDGRRAEARHARPDSPSRRDGPPDRTDRRDAGARRHASPSALAKRTRVSKSGGDGEAARRSARRSAPPSERRNEKDEGKARARTSKRRPGRDNRRDTRADGGRFEGKRTDPNEVRRAPRGETGGKRFTRKPSEPGAEKGPRRPPANTESRSGPRPARAGSGARGGANRKPGKHRPPRGPAPRPKR